MGGRKRKSASDPNQLGIPFDYQLNEKLAKIRSLHRLTIDIAPQTLRAVIEVLERIAICSDADGISRARVVYIGSGIPGRSVVTERTIRNWRGHAESLGLLKSVPLSQKYGGSETNVWTIRFDAIDALLRGEGGRQPAGKGPENFAAPGPENFAAPGPENFAAPTVTTNLTTYKTISGPDRTGPENFELQGSNTPGGLRPDNQPPAGSAAPGSVRGSQEPDALRNELLATHQLLRDPSRRPVAQLPPGGLVGNVFTPLKSESLRSTLWMVRWFRQQIGVHSPLTGSTEADLLLVLATAIYASEMQPAEVRKSRVGVFAFVVSKRRWRYVVAQLEAAVLRLAQLLARFPDALRHPQHLGDAVDEPAPIAGKVYS
jgi:hypothetical protein